MNLFIPFRNVFLFSAFGAMTFLLMPGCEETIFKPVLTGTEPDTTTHDWYFEVDTIGEHLSGARGIVAFSKDDAWVTGEFRIYNDPTNPNMGWEVYNLARWDGKAWKVLRFGSHKDGGAETLFAQASDFMVGYSFGLYLYNGQYWLPVSVPYGTILYGIYGGWVKSRSEINMVGGNGTWYIWDGVPWTPTVRKVPTPTTIDLTDIYGDGDRIYACGTNQSNTRSVLLLYERGTFTVIDSTRDGHHISINSLWYSAKDSLLALSDVRKTVIRNGIVSSGWDSYPNIPKMMAVRGSSANNIWWAGHFIDLVHYNGRSFQHFSPFPQGGQLKNISVHEDFFFAAGYQSMQNGELRGIVVRGYKRQ